VPIPVFVIYELLMRIHQDNPAIGAYASHSINSSGAVVVTTTRTVRIRTAILNRQFRDPTLVTSDDLAQIFEHTAKAPAAKKLPPKSRAKAGA